MRVSDRPNYPTAPRDSTYGCRHCGTYARRKQGDKLECRACRSALPLIDAVDAACSLASDTPGQRKSTPATDIS